MRHEAAWSLPPPGRCNNLPHIFSLLCRHSLRPSGDISAMLHSEGHRVYSQSKALWASWTWRAVVLLLFFAVENTIQITALWGYLTNSTLLWKGHFLRMRHRLLEIPCKSLNSTFLEQQNGSDTHRIIGGGEWRKWWEATHCLLSIPSQNEPVSVHISVHWQTSEGSTHPNPLPEDRHSPWLMALLKTQNECNPEVHEPVSHCYQMVF